MFVDLARVVEYVIKSAILLCFLLVGVGCVFAMRLAVPDMPGWLSAMIITWSLIVGILTCRGVFRDSLSAGKPR